jgi:hypothetical protein
MATRRQAGAEWVHVRPLRRPRAPGKPASDLRTRQPAGGCSSLPIIGRRLPASSSFASPAPAGATLRALQLDPGPARQHKPAAMRKSHNQSPPRPRRPSEQVTGSTQYALLTTGVLMGAATDGLDGFRELWTLLRRVRGRTLALPPACWLSATRSHRPAAYVPDVAGRAVFGRVCLARVAEANG